MKDTILFLPLHAASLLEMMPVAERLSQDGRYDPVFFIFRPIHRDYLVNLLDRDFRIIGPKALSIEPDNRQKGEKVGTKSTDHERNYKDYLKKKVLSLTFFAFWVYLVRFAGYLFRCRRILKNESVAALLVVGDRHVGWETAFIKAANQLGIPSLIIPFALSDPLGSFEFRLRHPESNKFTAQSWLGKLIARIFPQWVYETSTGRLFFLSLGESLAAKFLGIMPQNPWVIGGGDSTCMAVESEKIKANLLDHGINPSKIIVTGKPSMDQMVSAGGLDRAQSLREGLGLLPGQFLLLCSVPQLGEHGILPWSEHWQEVDFLFDALTRSQEARVVISLHPKSDPKAYQTFVDKYGVHLAKERIYQLIPECDVFIATYSSTVVQAIGFGKPAIVIDFYGLNYTFYDEEPGILIIRDRDKLVPSIDKLIHDPVHYRTLAEAQKQRAPIWILVDGQCTNRLIELLLTLIDKEDRSHG